MNVKSFSLLEVLAVIAIISVFVLVATGVFSRLVEKSRSSEAESSLMLIYNAQKRYRLDKKEYFSCAASCAPGDIPRNLNIVLQSNNFNYTIEKVGAAGYSATATRKSGPCANNKMTITDLSSTITKECKIWQ